MVSKRVKYLCVRLREREATPPPLALSRPKLLIISWDDEKVLKEWEKKLERANRRRVCGGHLQNENTSSAHSHIKWF